VTKQSIGAASAPFVLVPPEPSAAQEAPSDPRSTSIQPPSDRRSIALTAIALIAAVGALALAQQFFVPLLMGILIAYALSPLVALVERCRIPRSAATIIVMACVLGALGSGVYFVRGQMQRIVEQLPEAARTLSTALARLNVNSAGNLQKMQNAAAEVEKATALAAGGAPATRPSATHVIVDQPGFRLANFLLLGSMGALGFIGQGIMVLFLTFFLLLGGDTFKRKLVRLTGPTLSNKKISVQIMDDINVSIQKYLFMLLVTNVLVAVLTWAALNGIGLDNAGAWAVAAGLLHIIPYLGPGVTAAAIAMTAYMQFESFPMAILAGGASLVIATIVGTFVTTWMIGRIAKMNSAAVFISLLFWSWLWGVWGMLLSVPLIVIVKVVAEHVEPLHPVAEMLGE
jgi:predicted PurR-regulated permease PerM